MKYTTLVNASSERLDRQVNDLLAVGWKLHGNPFTIINSHCQAMILGEYPRPNRVAKKTGGKKDE